MPAALRITALLLTAILTASLLTGCGDESKDPGSEPSSPSDNPSGQTSSSTSEGPAPAAGLLVEQPTFSFHLPEAWVERDPHSTGTTVSSVSGGPADVWNFTDLTVETWNTRNFDDVTQLSGDVLENFRVTADKRKVQAMTEWAGQPAYHLTGTGSTAGYAEQFGVIWKDKHIAVIFDFSSKDSPTGSRQREFEITPAERQAVIDSVEASWEWK